MSRNFGLGQRDMAKAGYVALRNSAQSGAVSFSTVSTNSERWNKFSEWARSEHDVKKMENISTELLQKYGQQLAEKVQEGRMSAATAQNYVSAVNSVMSIATKGAWERISPTKDCGIDKRSAVRESAPSALDRIRYDKALHAVQEKLGERAGAVVEVAREFGLRSKEASLLNAQKALYEAQKYGLVRIVDGTKGGRGREISIHSTTQVQALYRAAHAQGDAKALMPGDQNWKGWREGELRAARELVQEHTGGGGLHDLRAAYACERYAQLTGHSAPCAGGQILDRAKELEVRLTISHELGHNRVDVTSEYLGGRT